MSGGNAVAKSRSQAEDGAPPEAALRAFFVAMNRWERAILREHRRLAKAGRPHELDHDHWLQQRLAIIVEHCTPKRRVYTEGLRFGDPPEYDPRREEITGVEYESAVRAVVFTKQHFAFEHTRRFVLLKRGGRWRIDNKQWQDGRRWERDIL
jgi:hypothetical protein